ncbi:glycosyltransferase family 4 protein [Clostridium sp. A1-XYC3]|uniref:Glycosyltransferase family 4 protein n=1 Tax=Clostridium tanneri TaxID=3037988 RepID=A0ABU4JQX5_9CLOT|nr:glycosyltransferase family 4 protein [Clostridium sp. A1-XYC3]MDW8800523.1 glycosyltransferase family 4 protein [Clostridium sp. A1-XYC3]
MKKILNIIAQKPGETGSGIYLRSLVKEGDRKNYHQAIVAGISAEDGEYSFHTNNNVNFYPVVFEREELPFPVVGMSDVMPYKSTRYRDLDIDMLKKWKKAFSDAISKAIYDFEPDIIICHHLWILTALVKEKYPDTRIIAFCHGTDLRQLEIFKTMDNKFSKEIIKYVTDHCKNIERVIVSQRDEKELVIKEYGIEEKNIRIAGTGFNPEIFYTGEDKEKEDRIKIIYAGKLSYSKGVPHLINAIKLLKQQYCNIELYLAGSGIGQEAKEITEECKRNSEEVNIHILGALPQKELGELFRQCDILVLPSLYEGLPLVLIEAMACGLKIVVTDLPGVKEWMGSTINNSGIIEYIPLPRLKDVDSPLEEDIPTFENNLSKAIKKQIENKLTMNSTLKEAIGKKSWKSAFEDIERLFTFK